MCKKRNPGCTCCCAPLLDRVDEFSSLWKCWKQGNPTIVPLTSTRYTVASGELKYTTAINFADSAAYLHAMAKYLPVPFSMEAIWEVAAWGTNKNIRWTHANSVLDFSGNGTPNPFGAASIGAFVSGFTPGVTAAYDIPWEVAATTTPMKFQYRIQVDSSTMAQWLWINDVLPTITSGTRSWGDNVAANTGLFDSSPTWSTGTARKWTVIMNAVNPEIRFSRCEFHTWNHITDPRPTP